LLSLGETRLFASLTELLSVFRINCLTDRLYLFRFGRRWPLFIFHMIVGVALFINIFIPAETGKQNDLCTQSNLMLIMMMMMMMMMMMIMIFKRHSCVLLLYCHRGLCFSLFSQSVNQSITYLNQAKAHRNRLDRQGSMRKYYEKITKLEKNSSKLELQNKNCSYTIFDKSVCRTT